MIRVFCKLSDCAYYNKPETVAAKEGQCDCAHPDKEMYLNKIPCPLYKREWSTVDPSTLADRFKKRKR